MTAELGTVNQTDSVLLYYFTELNQTLADVLTQRVSRTEAFAVQRKVEWLLNFCAYNPLREESSGLALELIMDEDEVRGHYLLMELTLGTVSPSQTPSASSRSRISHANMVGFCRL